MRTTLITVALSLISATSVAGTFAEVSSFGGNPGDLKMYVYTPDTPAANPPAVFLFHACTQTARNYHDNSGWRELADQHGFYLVYPEQQPRANPARCFNWAGEYGDPTNLTRGEGENESVKNMVQTSVANYGLDAARIYMSGHSGGGAQIALMLATWPELWAGAGIIAGIPYNCTTTFTEVSACLNPGLDKTPQQWGDRVRAGHPGFSGTYPKVSIWHGTSDGVVSIRNQGELLEQWTNAHGIDMTADGDTMVDGARRREYKDGGGVTRVETFEINGMGHGTPVTPGDNCGRIAGYFLDAGICSARRIAESLGTVGGATPPVDSQAPAVDVTAPADGATVMGIVEITVSASDNVAVTSVAIAINGATKATLTAAPYRYSWNTSAEANGTYAISATALDAAGNAASDADTSVTISGGVADTTPPTVNVTAPANGATVSGAVRLTADASDDFGVSRVEFYVDGTKVGDAFSAPYGVDWNAGQVAAGSHAISAKAIDAAGNEAVDDDTTVTTEMAMTGDTMPPTVNIASPADGDTLNGVVTVLVDATDDVEVDVVLLFANGDLIGSDYRPPFEFLWDAATTDEGDYLLTARAFDTAGNLAVDEDTNVTVSHSAVIDDPANPDGERVYLGKRRWGCSTSPDASEGAIYLAIFALALVRRRR